MSSTRMVFCYALLTAIATGLGALPFLFKHTMSPSWMAKAHAVAAALMITASFGLIYEGMHYTGYGLDQLFIGVPQSVRGTVGGILVGLIFIIYSHRWLEQRDVSIGDITGADAKKVLLIIGIMTIHSFTEGVALGVSFGPSIGFGIFIALAIALHNIPEGLAISTVLVSKGMKRRKAAGRSIFTSLPQPLMAVPAFLFVQHFAPFLPWGLGFAAGAMLWMSFSELIPDALEGTSPGVVATTVTISIAAMIIFQQLLG